MLMFDICMSPRMDGQGGPWQMKKISAIFSVPPRGAHGAHGGGSTRSAFFSSPSLQLV